MTRCTRCDRLVLVWPGQPRLCKERDLEECIALEWERLVLGDQVAPPPEPLQEDAPADLGVCGPCKGLGSHLGRQDWETGAFDVEECRVCEGTGVAPVCGVPGWHPVGS